MRLKNERGFTLIELLVVVLIIGVLASIAVPKYTKIIEQSKFAEAKALVKALGDSQERYKETNGIPSLTFEGLDVTIPDTEVLASTPYSSLAGGRLKNKNFSYIIDTVGNPTWYGTVIVIRNWGKYANCGYIYSQKSIYCIELANSTQNFCKGMMNGTFLRTDNGVNLYTTEF